ncbi:MAG: dihydrolipoamide acetyltransferase family protein [Bacteroidota bacterium]|nr:dihydrolipoamide acetyltransferase family protein [Bacteroidota bacterium]
MSKVEVVMPQLGESLTEGTIVKWHKKPGDKIKKDETLLEISTDKVDSEIPSPASGIITKILFEEQKTVTVRTVIAEIETDFTAISIEAPSKFPDVPIAAPIKESTQTPSTKTTATEKPITGRFYSPLVLSIAHEEGISMGELEQLSGSGEGGRVTKKDMLTYINTRQTGKPSLAATQPSAPTQVGHLETTLKHVESGDLAQKYPSPQYEILQMSNVIAKMSEHMVKSVNTSPHVWAVHECDMTNVDKARKKNAESFEKREGFKLTYTPFVCDAVIKTLKQFPLVNASVDGDKIILKKFVNLGIAVASENGLIVPVIKNADEKNFVGLARSLNDLATRARIKRLVPSEIEGGTFTITNFGVFNTLIGIPIINQPQVAILGTGAIKKRPVVISTSGEYDAIAIRLIAHLTLAFDHRIVDGALGGTFLGTVCKLLENYDSEKVL